MDGRMTETMRRRLFLPDQLLAEHNFFELYPFDGGGYFIQQEIVRSLDDRTVTRNILSGALDEFGPLEEIDFTRFERWSSIEKSCWINRMYFVVSLARTAMLERDRGLAETVLAIVRRFNRAYPPPPTRQAVQDLQREVLLRRDRDYNSGSDTGEIPYQWFDFQPASRIVNVLNAMNFLRDFDLPQEEFRRFVRSNARVILDADDAHALSTDNHQTLRGTALLYAGRYLEDPALLQAGNIVANHHALHDYLEDGMGVDMSPSYHVFTCWINRDAARLGDLDEPARQRLAKAFRICQAFRQPDDRSIVLNDGYPLDMRGFLKSIGQETAPASGRLATRRSGLAFHRSPALFAALDATPCLARYSHFHGGKNGVTLWLDGRPFLVDSGCCSYDDPRFWEWFKRPEAHSTLLIDGKGDGRLQGRYEWSKTTGYRLDSWNDDAVVCSTGVWRRRLRIAGERKAVISDRVVLKRKSSLEFIFVLHPDVQADLRDGSVVLRNGPAVLEIECRASAPGSWRLAPGCFFDGVRAVPAQRIVASIQAREFTWRLTCTGR